MYKEKFIFYPSSYKSFDFHPYKQACNHLYSEINRVGLVDKNNMILTYLFSFAYSQTIFYISANSYLKGELTDDVRKEIVGHTRYVFGCYIDVIVSEFLPWLKYNYDRYDFFYFEFSPISFRKEELEKLTIHNLFLDDTSSHTASIVKLIHTFYQMKMCKSSETPITEIRNYSEMYSTFGIKIDFFKDKDGDLIMPDFKKYKDITDDFKIFEALFTRWQAYCLAEHIYQLFQKNKNHPEIYSSHTKFSHFKIKEDLDALVDFLEEIYENPIDARFLHYMHDVNHAQDPLGDTDSRTKLDERLESADPYSYHRYINDCRGFSFNMLKKEYKELINNHKKVKTSMFSNKEVPFEEFWKSDINHNKINDFWLNNKRHLYILDLLILEKILSIKLKTRSLDDILDLDSKIFSRYVKDINARFNYDVIMMLSLKDNIDEKLRQSKNIK